ncbi:o-succinylbenzoate synthase [Oceanobacillus oncorhynchi subsp. incaldanensis]|uniref:o-succinylbenzoate synthase n=1 Tax=Oceanobacillus oncorhynchi TaxID=545501 RepID=A0A0A1ML47_9BACI|nr:o-succinylbenzoate synthase [Oceanobacillus oncorhynchi]MDM8099144.1 o-succinylbenzoate synthase [Oceanobacillus oncorhynchi]GIO20395.1 o-succinylbenzoate synthase [Oceanobacillus oncorhynchi subsp. incaldanensis]CEI80417.1 o-succinylbenzoate synthase [Oceanobacillus oncorhynchi]
MKITEVTVRHLQMKLKAPFTTSFGTFTNRDFLLLEAKDADGTVGWGESVAFHAPWYNEETLQTNWHMLEDFLIPLILNKELKHPDEVNEIFAAIRKNNMAKSTLEGAIWDIYSQQTNQSLAEALGGRKEKIEVGISIGIQKSIEDLIALVDGYIKEGYKRMKVKIKPGWDIDVIRTLREKFPDTAIMADANSAYRLEDTELLKQLDAFDLTMIEQPLASDDIIDHAKLQKELQTPICLDESIHSLEDARKAVELGSTKIINIKIGRVGGLTEAKKIHDYCAANDIPVWCGGMLESGIGRSHNIALTTLPNFILPGDTAGSSRYWEKDIIAPEVVAENGYITVPTKAGIGYEVDRKAVEAYTVVKKDYK